VFTQCSVLVLNTPHLAVQLLLGVVDTAMLAQNAITAAESLGLGGVYIGGIRNSIEAVTELLQLPKHVLPLFGLCLGWPNQSISYYAFFY